MKKFKKLFLVAFLTIALFGATAITVHAWTVEHIWGTGASYGEWHHRMTGVAGIGNVQSETIGLTNFSESRASANGVWSTWASPWTWARRSASRGISGNTSGCQFHDTRLPR